MRKLCLFLLVGVFLVNLYASERTVVFEMFFSHNCLPKVQGYKTAKAQADKYPGKFLLIRIPSLSG